MSPVNCPVKMVLRTLSPRLNFRCFSGQLWLGLLNLGIIAFLLLPPIYLVSRASDDPSTGWAYVRHELSRSVLNSLQLAAAVGLTSMLIGVPLAWLTVRTDLKGCHLWTVLCTLPLAIPSYVGAFALIAAFGPKGMLQGVLEDLFGIERLPQIYGFFGAWLSITLFTFPYVFLSVRAGLQGLDPRPEEASRILGHSAWSTFRRITLPQLLPSIQSGLLLTLLYTLNDFGAVAFMRYNAFTRVIFRRYLVSPAQTAALSLLLVWLAMLILSFSNRQSSRAYYRRSTRHPLPPLPLGKWQFLAQAFCGLVITLALIAPIAVIAYWLINGLQRGETFQDFFAPMQRSLRVSAITAAIASLVALPLVFMPVRFPGRFSKALQIASYLGFSLPGIVVAISLVYFGRRLDTRIFGLSIYQTLPLLIFGYLVRFLPQMLGPLTASLLQVNPHLEESARTLGKSTPAILATITLPLMRPGGLAGTALVFLTVMKELPITLILAPTGYHTLATRIWTNTESAFYARAAAPALLLLFASALSLIYILEPDHER
jgi:iron(III) transport system permease protein